MNIYGYCSDNVSDYHNLRRKVKDIPLLENQRIVLYSIIDIIMRKFMTIQELTNGFKILEYDDYIMIQKLIEALRKSCNTYLNMSIDNSLRQIFFKTIIVCELIDKLCDLEMWMIKNPFQ